MSQKDYDMYLKRLVKGAVNSAESGARILSRNIEDLDHHSIRAAAAQLRQAAKELDELDGALSAVFLLRMSEKEKS